jgi:hypothetical protein
MVHCRQPAAAAAVGVIVLLLLCCSQGFEGGECADAS